MRLSLVGRKFNKLTVVSYAGPKHVLCSCECGNTVTVWKANLYRDNTTSCGCNYRTAGGLSKKHPIEHGTWNHMLRRCYDEKDKSFRDYGARGVTVCDRWKDSFESFFADMGKRPSKLHSLDRIDNSMGYSPENCRWATRLEQNNNTRRNRPITYKGRTQGVYQWAEELGLPRMTLYNRIYTLGWEMDRAMRPRK